MCIDFIDQMVRIKCRHDDYMMVVSGCNYNQPFTSVKVNLSMYGDDSTMLSYEEGMYVLRTDLLCTVRT